jgi:hypothetical protein
VCNYDKVNDLLFFIEISLGIKYGFALYQTVDDNWIQGQDTKFDDLAELIQDIDSSFSRGPYHLGLKEPKRTLHFESFTCPEMYALANSVKRGEYLDQLVEEIDVIVNEFNAKYSANEAEYFSKQTVRR